MYALKDLIADALSNLIGSRRARQTVVLSAWSAVVGEARSRHARPLGIKGQVLIVATDLPALFYELGLRREELLNALNTRAGGRVIDDIQIVMRPLDGPPAAADDGRGTAALYRG
jgi:predicted nucleic acid-binding Zn ribbon protein